MALADKDINFAKVLRSIYHAPTGEIGSTNIQSVTEKDSKYPNALRSWNVNWDSISPIFKLSAEVRKVTFTTDAIKSLNSSFK